MREEDNISRNEQLGLAHIARKAGLPLAEIEQWYQRFLDLPVPYNGKVGIIYLGDKELGYVEMKGKFDLDFFQMVKAGGMTMTIVNKNTGHPSDYKVILAIPLNLNNRRV